VRIGIIGTGVSALWHVNAIKKQNQVTDIIVFDINLQAGRNFSEKYGIGVVETVKELYEQVEAVIICSPTPTHYDLAMEAMRRRKHVLCEKPMALNVEEAKRMADTAKEIDIVCAVGFNYRFFDVTETWRKRYAQDDIRRIKLMIKRRFRNDWHHKGNGVLMDLGIHLIDLLVYLCGQKIILNSCKKCMKYKEGWDYYAQVWGETEGRIPFELVSGRSEDLDEVCFRMEIDGDKNVFRFDSREEQRDFFDFSESVQKQDQAWIQAISWGRSGELASFDCGLYAQNVLAYFLVE